MPEAPSLTQGRFRRTRSVIRDNVDAQDPNSAGVYNNGSLAMQAGSITGNNTGKEASLSFERIALSHEGHAVRLA